MTTLMSAIEHFLQAKEAAYRSDATIAKYRDFLTRFSSFVGAEKCIEEVRAEEIRHFLADKRRQGLAPSSLDTYFRTLHTFWKWAEQEYSLLHNPMQGIERPRIPKKLPPYLSDDEIYRLLAAAGNSRNPERDRAILLLLLDTGIRAGELVRLRIQDVDLANGMITVFGKDKEERRIPISRTTTKALRAYIGERIESPDAPVFLSSKTGKAFTVGGLRDLVRRLGEAAGLQRRIYPHLFRHTFAYRWIKMGGNLEKLRQILGHSRLDTTSIYAVARLEDIVEEHHRLRPADKLVEGAMVLSLL